ASDMADAFYYRQKHDANSTYSPWRQVASRDWVTSQNYASVSDIPTNYVTTNTNQTGLGGNKTWTGHHIIAPGNTSSPTVVANSVRISRNTDGAFVTIENSSA